MTKVRASARDSAVLPADRGYPRRTHPSKYCTMTARICLCLAGTLQTATHTDPTLAVVETANLADLRPP